MTKKITRDLAERLGDIGFTFDPALFVLENIANENLDLSDRLSYCVQMTPYLYAKKKDITVEGAVQGNLTISWLNNAKEEATSLSSDENDTR